MEGDAPEPLRWWNLTRRETLVIALAALVAAGSFTVYALTRPAPPEVVPLERVPLEARVRVNQATAAELTVIPGVGEKTAARMLAERTAHGPFMSLADLLSRVSGLDPDKLAPFAAYLDFEVRD